MDFDVDLTRDQNYQNCDCFQQVKKTQQTSIKECTVIQLCFCCNIHYEFSQQLAISNPTRSDFKYPSDFGFLKKCQIPSDSDTDSESVTSLINCLFHVCNYELIN